MRFKSATQMMLFLVVQLCKEHLYGLVFMTVAAGPLFNFIFSGIIFFAVYMNQGVTKLPLTVEKVFERLIKNSFEKGDIIRSINGVQIFENFKSLMIIYLKIVDLMKNLLMLSKEMDRL